MTLSRWLLVVFSSLVIAAVVGAATPGEARPAGAADTFTIGVPLPLSDFSAYTIASQLGFDAAEGVSFKIVENTGANTANLVASGQLDVASFTAATAVILSQQGKQTSIIWNNENQPGLALVSSPDITTLAQLRAKSNCRFAMPPPGSSTYTAALTYIRTQGLKNCELVPQPSQQAQTNGVVSGAYQATVLGFSGAVTIVNQGGHMLIDPTTKKYLETYGRTTFPAGVLFGLKSNLQGKRSNVISALRAILAADNYINTHTNAAIIKVVQKQAGYATQPQAALEAGFLPIRPYLGVNAKSKTSKAGEISAADWKKAVTAAAQFGIAAFDANGPSATYANGADMSYYKAAFPHMAVIDAKHRTLASLAKANSKKWQTLYATAKPWMSTLGLPAAKVSTARLAIGTTFWWK